MTRKARLAGAVFALVFALVAASPAAAGHGSKNALKFSVEILAW